MAKVLHAIAILIIACESLASNETVSAGSGSPSITTARADTVNHSSTQSTTHAATSSLKLTTKPPGSTETQRSLLSPKSIIHTSALNTANTTEPHQSNSPKTTTHSTVTEQPESASSSHGSNGSIPEQSTKQMDKNESTGTTMPKTTKPLSTKQHNKTVSTQKINTAPNPGNSLAGSPGLVAILCIFFIVLTLVLIVVIAKVISACRNPKFERLEDLPMNKMSEDLPFAQYPPK